MLDTIHYTLGDCIEGMKQFPDGFFDLAVVDPPYGDAGGVRPHPNRRNLGDKVR